MVIKKVLIPVPSYGFDPTEAAIPWKLMRENNFEIVFITPNGEKAAARKEVNAYFSEKTLFSAHTLLKVCFFYFKERMPFSIVNIG